uniref:Large ribosomal subunit protein P2 n=1 Tax=Amblyomma cajennense TaxID=34607 RepID=A0A023FCS2_AMBCJ
MLVKQAETHVVVLLRLFLLFLFLGRFLWSCCTTTGSRCRSGRCGSSCTTTRGHGSQLFLALRDYFVDGLPLQLADDLLESFSVGIESDSERLKKVISELKGKSVDEVIAKGKEKLATMPSGGGAAAAAAPAPAAAAGGGAAAPKESAKKEEKKEESEEDDDMGFGLFD